VQIVDIAVTLHSIFLMTTDDPDSILIDLIRL
jgi:hypothetical protein